MRSKILSETFSRRSLLKNSILLFEAALYLISFICFFYFLPKGPVTKIYKCIIIMGLLLGYRFIPLFFKIKLHDLLKLSVLIFIFMAMFLAEILDFYTKIFFFDKILHTLSGAMIFFLGQALFKRVDNSQKSLQSNTKLMVLFSTFFSIAMADCWEIFEFSLDRIMGYHLQLDSLFDTMEDIICGTSTAVIMGICTHFSLKAKETNTAKNHPADATLADCSEAHVKFP